MKRILIVTVFDTAYNIIIVLSPDNRIVEFNNAAERLFLSSRDEVLSQSYLDL